MAAIPTNVRFWHLAVIAALHSNLAVDTFSPRGVWDQIEKDMAANAGG